jgi:hypothetical protein
MLRAVHERRPPAERGNAVLSNRLGSGVETATFNVTRTNAFAGASYTAGRVTFGAEFGRLFGGHVPPMLNTFGGRSATASRGYLTLGARIPAGRTNDRD